MAVARAIEQLLADPAHVQHIVQRDVPMLASGWGAKDEDALIHTLGINLLGSMGKAAGYMGLIEYPVPRAQRWQKKLVRVDAAWIDRHTRQPAVLVEFERFSMDTVLAKQTNLYVAAHGCAVPPAVLLLCVWALDGEPVNTSWYEVDRPLPVPGGPSVTRPASSYMVLVQAVLGCRGDLHQHGITHGDLKPDNLLLDEPSGRLKITDFGSSRRLTDNLIRTTRHAGAWAYQAPEIQQANQRGAISDLFSVGAVMYHAATGRLPRASSQALLTSAPITRPRQFNPAIPPALDDLVMQLLVDDPSRRLPSACELQRQLQVMLVQEHLPRLPIPQPLPPGTGHLDRAAVFLTQGKLEEARTAAAEATLHSTGLILALELYAKLSDQLGYTDDAILAFKRIRTLDSVSEETCRAVETCLADLYLRLHRYEDAEVYIERTLLIQPVPKAIAFKAAIVLGACTKLERALKLLESLELVHPKDGAVLEKKAWILWLLHRYEDAARVARDVLDIMPDNEICLRRLIDYETLMGNTHRVEHYQMRLALLEQHIS